MRASAFAIACAAGIVLGACLPIASITCAEGVVCPAESACDDVHHGCVRPDQLTSCAGKQEGDTCPIDAASDGLCDRGVCLRIFCGDGSVNGKGEECDGDN